jgi:hypothetical protein
VGSKRHPAAWRKRDDTYDAYVLVVKEQGYEQPVDWTGIESRERLLDVVRGIHRSRKHFELSMKVEPLEYSDGTFGVRMTLFDKAKARAYIKNDGRWSGR